MIPMYVDSVNQILKLIEKQYIPNQALNLIP